MLGGMNRRDLRMLLALAAASCLLLLAQAAGAGGAFLYLAPVLLLAAPLLAGRVADRAVQVFGGRGYMRENVAERFYRELRVERIWEGTSEVHRVIIAGQLAKRGLRALV